MIPNKRFVEALSNPYFSSEGALSKDVWLCGIEPGLDKSTSVDEYHQRFESSMLIKDEPHKSYEWKESFTYPFGQKFGWFYQSLLGKNPRKYRDLEKIEARVFKTNLYPLPFPDVSMEHWNTWKLSEITGLSNKAHYQLLCEKTRFKAYSEGIGKHEPKVIFCFGHSFLMDTIRCFGSYQNIKLINTYNVDEVKLFQVTFENIQTQLWVLPFLGHTQGTLNSYDIVQKTAQFVLKSSALKF